MSEHHESRLSATAPLSQRIWRAANCTVRSLLESERAAASLDAPRTTIEAWSRTTSGVVALLLALQIVTGTLLAFYYAPSIESAYTTVAYIEKVVPTGYWIRALHHHGSQMLTLFLALDLAQKFWHASYRSRPISWLISIVLLAFVLANSATGYSLPWDARAFFSTRIGENLLGGLPLVGSGLRHWYLGGTEAGALTLTRLYALHVLVVPALMLFVIALGFHLTTIKNEDLIEAEQSRRAPKSNWRSEQRTRQWIIAGFAFLAIAFYAMKCYAPIGPAAGEAANSYLPRPGAQFLWLFQALKLLPGRVASIIVMTLPALALVALATLPFLASSRSVTQTSKRRVVSGALFALGIMIVMTLTLIAYLQDARNPQVRVQLIEQAKEEASYRAAPFVPLRLSGQNEPNDATSSALLNATKANSARSDLVQNGDPPAAYTANCARCHGARGQGTSLFPSLINVAAKPRRTVDDIINLLNDPAAYKLHPPMRSFATKLTEDEKRAVAEWVVALKKQR